MHNALNAENLLLSIGGKATLKGFRYLNESILLAYENDDAIYNLSNNIFPKVCEKFEASYESVERNMRTVIKNTWNEYEEALQSISLTKLKSQPTVKDFIGIVVKHLKYKDDN